MREDDSNWFSRWEEQLPSPEELMPLSQTLISPDLALAFDIRSNPNLNPNPNSNPNPNPNPNTITNTNATSSPQHAPTPPPPPVTSLPPATPTHPNSSADLADSADLGSGGGGGPGDEPARTLKRPRLVWTPQLHKRFVDAVAHLGIKNAVPKTIMQLMSVDGLTRENVASHLQKYRLYLKRMQGLSAGTGGGGGGGGSTDSATDHLFASSPVPAHFLHPGRPNSDHFLPFVPVALQHHHQQQQQHMAAAAAVAATHPQMQQSPQYHQHRQPQVGHFGSPPNPNAQFEHPFLARQSQAVHRMGQPIYTPAVSGYIEDMESANAAGATGRKVLTLFPTGDD